MLQGTQTRQKEPWGERIGTTIQMSKILAFSHISLQTRLNES